MIRSTPQEFDEMKALCREWGPRLLLRSGEANGTAVLWALFQREHYDPHNSVPRLEKAYCPGGRYFTPNQDRLWTIYGPAAAKSYSNFQILYPVAVELGFTGPPVTLEDDAVAIEYVVRLLNRRLIPLSRKDDGKVKAGELFDAYNSGNPRDVRTPEVQAYVADALMHYAEGLALFA